MNADLITGETGFLPQNPPAVQESAQLKSYGFLDRDGLKGGRKEAKVKEKDRNPMEVEKRGEDGGYAMNNKVWGSAKPATFDALSNGGSKAADYASTVQGKNTADQMTAGSKRKLKVLSSEGKEVGNKVQALDVDDPEQGREGVVEELSSKRQQTQKQSETLKPSEAQPAVSSAGWESFLPQRSIKVLLAEDDDSTRHVVGALLRNCSYEVTSVSNGMQAWEMLEDPNCHFDLVLTDVVMPCLSGVGLLSKIQSRQAGERIPVIIMSAHDSVDIVFRCLSKGAADFLVKPVRKNELKNLWQHVWRYQSSSGSGSGGSGSGSGVAKITRTKSRVGSGNNSASNDRSDDNSSGLNVRGGSDNGSGTQAAIYGQKAKRDRANGQEGQATSVQKLSNEQIMGQELEMATRREDPKEGHFKDVHDCVNETEKDGPSTSGNSENECMEDHGSDPANSGGPSATAIDLIGGIAFQDKGDVVEVGEIGDGGEALDRGGSNSPGDDKGITSSNSPPVLELSLKRSRGPEEEEEDKEDRRVLRHSDGSAFSRYSISAKQMPSGGQVPFSNYFGTHSLSPATGPLGSGASGQLARPLEHAGSSKGVSAEATAAPPSHPRASQNVTGQVTGSSRVGSSAKEGYSQQLKDEALSVMSGQGIPLPMRLPPRALIYDGVTPGYGPAMHPVFYAHTAAPPWANATNRLPDRETYDHASYRDHAVHPSHHSSHRHHQQSPSHHSQIQQASLGHPQEEQVVLSHMSGAPWCGSSNMTGSLPDCAGNITVNGAGVPAGEVSHELNRFARREAALNKFRQKRKDRCFEKKVRYQSRKRLAEQRPRVRGQFVRQAVYDSNTGHEICD